LRSGARAADRCGLSARRRRWPRWRPGMLSYIAISCESCPRPATAAPGCSWCTRCRDRCRAAALEPVGLRGQRRRRSVHPWPERRATAVDRSLLDCLVLLDAVQGKPECHWRIALLDEGTALQPTLRARPHPPGRRGVPAPFPEPPRYPQPPVRPSVVRRKPSRSPHPPPEHARPAGGGTRRYSRGDLDRLRGSKPCSQPASTWPASPQYCTWRPTMTSCAQVRDQEAPIEDSDCPRSAISSWPDSRPSLSGPGSAIDRRRPDPDQGSKTTLIASSCFFWNIS